VTSVGENEVKDNTIQPPFLCFFTFRLLAIPRAATLSLSTSHVFTWYVCYLRCWITNHVEWIIFIISECLSILFWLLLFHHMSFLCDLCNLDYRIQTT